MKKIMLMIVAVVMTMFCVFSVAGCNQDPTPGPDDEEPNPNESQIQFALRTDSITNEEYYAAVGVTDEAIVNLVCCFVNRFLRDFKKFSKLFLFSGF